MRIFTYRSPHPILNEKPMINAIATCTDKCIFFHERIAYFEIANCSILKETLRDGSRHIWWKRRLDSSLICSKLYKKTCKFS